VVAEGTESGGHIGEMATMALLPQVCDATDLPVIAAGGIADGRQVAAAFLLGAEGVQMGTRFLVAEECPVHPNFKEQIITAKDVDTIVTGRRLNHATRGLKTPFSLAVAQAEYDAETTKESLMAQYSGSLRRAVLDGNVQEGAFMAGQVSGMITQVQPAAEIIREVFCEAEAAFKGAARWVE